MDFVTGFDFLPGDPLLRAAVLSGLLIAALTACLLVAILAVRLHAATRTAREAALQRRWLPRLLAAQADAATALPTLRRGERRAVLVLWIHLCELVRGRARDRFRALALRLGLDAVARRLFSQSALRDRLIGIAALGRLGCNDCWGELAETVRQPDPVLSFVAVRALLQIDPRRAAPLLMTEMTRRSDWPMRSIVAAVTEVDPSLLAADLATALRMARHDQLPRLLAVAEMASGDDVAALLLPLLDEKQPPEILIGALKATRDGRAGEMVRALVGHEDWRVRVQVAAALGRFGRVEDVDRLVGLLSDRQWWVRYRAAHALADMAALPTERLRALCAGLADAYAKEILTQALAESALRRPA